MFGNCCCSTTCGCTTRRTDGYRLGVAGFVNFFKGKYKLTPPATIYGNDTTTVWTNDWSGAFVAGDIVMLRCVIPFWVDENYPVWTEATEPALLPDGYTSPPVVDPGWVYPNPKLYTYATWNGVERVRGRFFKAKVNTSAVPLSVAGYAQTETISADWSEISNPLVAGMGSYGDGSYSAARLGMAFDLQYFGNPSAPGFSVGTTGATGYAYFPPSTSNYTSYANVNLTTTIEVQQAALSDVAATDGFYSFPNVEYYSIQPLQVRVFPLTFYDPTGVQTVLNFDFTDSVGSISYGYAPLKTYSYTLDYAHGQDQWRNWPISSKGWGTTYPQNGTSKLGNYWQQLGGNIYDILISNTSIEVIYQIVSNEGSIYTGLTPVVNPDAGGPAIGILGSYDSMNVDARPLGAWVWTSGYPGNWTRHSGPGYSYQCSGFLRSADIYTPNMLAYLVHAKVELSSGKTLSEYANSAESYDEAVGCAVATDNETRTFEGIFSVFKRVVTATVPAGVNACEIKSGGAGPCVQHTGPETFIVQVGYAMTCTHQVFIGYNKGAPVYQSVSGCNCTGVY